MATIAQTTPMYDTVDTADSESYSNQLLATGATPPVTFVTTVPSPGFTVSPAGYLATTGSLAVGPYTASGTMHDGASNTGTWSFTLTVKVTLQPQIATSIQAMSPAGVEMLVPFQIDPSTGGTTVLTAYNEIVAQHIVTILMTAPGERVMNPTYGFGILEKVFLPIYQNTPAVFIADINDAIKRFEPAVNVVNTTATQDPNYPEVLNITISFSLLPSNDVNVVSFSVGGTVAQVIYT